MTPRLMRASGDESTLALKSLGRRGKVGSRNRANQRITVKLVIEQKRHSCASERVLISLVEEGG
jgi:hypothetical protein